MGNPSVSACGLKPSTMQASPHPLQNVFFRGGERESGAWDGVYIQTSGLPVWRGLRLYGFRAWGFGGFHGPVNPKP